MVRRPAGYGAGGSVVAPHVAKLLGLPLLDRAISSRVAARLRVSVKEAEGGAARRSLPDRFISALVPLAAGVIATNTDTLPRDLIAPPGDGALFREQADAIMRAATGPMCPSLSGLITERTRATFPAPMMGLVHCGGEQPVGGGEPCAEFLVAVPTDTDRQDTLDTS